MGKITTEKQFKNIIHKALPKIVYRLGISNRYAKGVPDVYYEGTKGILWVEYKFKNNLISPLQLDWLIRAKNNSVPVLVIVGKPDGKHLLLENEMQWRRYNSKLKNVSVPYTIERIVNTICLFTMRWSDYQANKLN